MHAHFAANPLKRQNEESKFKGRNGKYTFSRYVQLTFVEKIKIKRYPPVNENLCYEISLNAPCLITVAYIASI